MITQVLPLKPGDFVQTNESRKKYMVVESCNTLTGSVICIWFNEESKSFERISIFVEDLEFMDPE